jgi:predicted membrane channel-forming protein YqfA (hemolysin III family)
MVRESWVRFTLWVSCPFNLGAAALFAVPGAAPAQLVGLPPSAPAVYAALVTWLVALFGFTYAWLAQRREIDRPLVGMLAIGKTGVFVVAVVLAIAGASAPRLVALAAGDLALGLLWLTWLVQSRA